jgi:hypothetical protein
MEYNGNINDISLLGNITLQLPRSPWQLLPSSPTRRHQPPLSFYPSLNKVTFVASEFRHSQRCCISGPFLFFKLLRFNELIFHASKK